MAEPSWTEVANLIAQVGDEHWIGARLESLRGSTSREDLADAMMAAPRLKRYAIGRTGIWKIETGQRSVSVGEAIALASVLNVPITDLLLPDDAIQELDGWQHFAAAAEALKDVLDAWRRYEDEIRFVRTRIAARPALADRINDYSRDAATQRADQHRAIWLNDHEGNLKSESAFQAFLRRQEPTPAIIAAEDAVSGKDLREDHWFADRVKGTGK